MDFTKIHCQASVIRADVCDMAGRTPTGLPQSLGVDLHHKHCGVDNSADVNNRLVCGRINHGRKWRVRSQSSGSLKHILGTKAAML